MSSFYQGFGCPSRIRRPEPWNGKKWAGLLAEWKYGFTALNRQEDDRNDETKEPNMGLKATLAKRVNRGGFCVAGVYVLVVVVFFAFTAYNTKPANVGYDWIPFVLLSVPWYALDGRLLFPGLMANAGLMYLLGMLLDTLWRRITKE